ncbi:MAG TPA: aminotransferase class V-fold PLP-dependent enzyme [Chloroflexota bacterium]|jgi:(S)-ureidoglycine-glyoxylate aminotransferase|nr:aminotransferase class V-fold PLP-dependent enzyme [Chloroflexota bacterium]
MTHTGVGALRRGVSVGGPSTPDERVLLALTAPVIGQFDPAFTAVMDEVMQLARATFLTRNARCFPISALPSAGLEALLNTLVQDGERVRILGSPGFQEIVADIVGRCGGKPADSALYTVAPHVDPFTAEVLPLVELARKCHEYGGLLLLDATYSLAGRELRTDEWHLDAVVAGADYCVGAPSGMTLVTYNGAVERSMHERTTPPRTSYLDLLELQAYWSPERLNHHTAPTSLVYGLHEALRLLLDEGGLDEAWSRHAAVSQALRDGFHALGLDAHGDGPLLLARAPDAERLRGRLREKYAMSIATNEDGTWRIALLGADAQPQVVEAFLAALRSVLTGG